MVNKADSNSRGIVGLLWLYLILLIFEGSLRKWVFPSLSNPLLFVRDPIALAIYVSALSSGRADTRPLVFFTSILGIVALFIGFALNASQPFVSLYGFKANFLHLPLVFIAGTLLTRKDILNFGRFVLICGILMLPIMAKQFRSPPDSFWNLAPGGGTDAQMEAALGRIRPPGFFSFITGVGQFSALQAAFILVGFMQPGTYGRLLLFASSASLVLNVAISTSRLTVGYVATVLACMLLLVFLNRKFAGRLFWTAGSLAIMGLVLSCLDLFQEGTEVFAARLDRTGDLESGLSGTSVNWAVRSISDFTDGFASLGSAPILGHGLGVGTNVGARLLSGKVGFLIAEGEWARMILELGPVIGLVYLGLRVAIFCALANAAIKKGRLGDPLPLLLLGAGSWLLLNGQFGQTTTCGFAVFAALLSHSAALQGNVATSSTPERQDGPKVRSRSNYAQYLYGRPKRSHSGSPQ